jgi:hypothetical protein
MVNMLTDCSAAMAEDGEGLWPRWRLTVEFDGLHAGVDDVCSPGSWAGAVRGFARLLDHAEELLGSRGRGELAMFAGLEEPVTREGGVLEGRLIADTSLVYRGLHNLVYAGRARAVLPQCLVAEVTRAYAEAAKAGAEPVKRLKSLLAYHALEELRAAGATVAPSPPGPCDTSIPEMPAHLLSAAKPATADTGAYNYWRTHPATGRLAEPVLVASRGVEARDPGMAGYAVLQATAILATVAHLLYKGQGEVTLRVELEGEEGQKTTIDTRTLGVQP